MEGKWEGTYWYLGKLSKSLLDGRVGFEMTIYESKEVEFIGEISDKIEEGGTRGIGSVVGTVQKNKIEFVKQMPFKSVVMADGTRIEEKKKHRPIYYSGIIDEFNGSIEGTWKFKKGIGFVNGRLALYGGTKGKWEMKKCK
ncbi:MAG: hypothetical protein ACI9N1_002403 [Flavobacteriales bacterium]|jgi:hypothetical protein